jgi:trans-aconitate methyltransferase
VTWTPTIANCDNYLDDRTGKYEYRAIRYRAAIEAMLRIGLDDTMTIYDIGAGMTEFDYTLRAEYGWRGRYIPIDGGIDGTDLNTWTPPREAHFFVALEILEHLSKPYTLLTKMQMYAARGVILSTPNPDTTDVLGMDPTHKTPIHTVDLERYGVVVSTETFYGGVFSEGKPDSLFGVWTP